MKKLLNISDLNQDDFNSILQFADDLNTNTEQILSNKNIGLIFEKIQLGQDYHFKLALIS